jgi:hypothetical protein
MKTTFPATLPIVIALCAGLLLSGPKYAAAEPGKSNALYASASTDALQQQIVSKEREELETLKTGDLKHFADLLADDAIFVDDHGAASKSAIVEHTVEFRLTEYSLDDVKFVPLSATSGLISYKIRERGEFPPEGIHGSGLRFRPVDGAGREDGLCLQPGDGGEMMRASPQAEPASKRK